jgi:hypothetical protein
MILSGLTFISVVILVRVSQNINRIFRSEVLKGLHRTAKLEKQILTEDDIKSLPDIVKKYLLYVGAVGKEKVKSLRTVTEIYMELGADRGNAKMTAVEYNFFDDNPARLVLMKFTMKGLPVTGLDSYINGKGRMLMKPLGLLTVVDATGTVMDNSSAAVMLLLNMCIAAPSTLIDDRITWTDISSSSIKVTFQDNECIVSGVLDFNEEGELINFSTEDKYYSPSGGSYKKVRWSTPVKDYSIINGLKLSTYGEATWHFPEGDFCYGKLKLEQIDYNCIQ